MKIDKENAPLGTLRSSPSQAVILYARVLRAPRLNPIAPDKILANTSNKMNRTLPQMVDAITRLDATVQRPGRIFSYKYTVLGFKAAKLNKEQIRAAIEPTLLHNYKTNPSMSALRKLSAILKYAYFDEAGAFILDIEVDPATFTASAPSANS